MKENVNELYEKFLKIKNQGWIESKRKGPTGIGYTFEELINKEEENFPIPDYKGIEIKTTRKYSNRNLHLFTATPDGDYLFPIKRMLNILGYPDRENKEYKILNVGMNAKEFTYIGFYKKVKLFVNRKEEKIEVIATNDKGIPKEVNTSWSFEFLKQRLHLKLNYLAIVEAESKMINDKEYFYYNKIKFYKFINFENFIDQIEKGRIIVTFKIGVYKSGTKIGQIYDHGTDFSIDKKEIKYLFDNI